MMMFDEDGQVQQYSVILSKRSHEHLGQLRNISSLVSKINLSSANEISFIVYKYTDKERYLNAETNDEKLRYSEPLWDEITDFKYIFIPELKEYYEIAVECNDEESLYKSVTGTSACECELAQSKIYGLEINSEIDIARTDYTTPTVFYDKLNPKSSLLHRVLSKLPQYSIEYVDTSLMKLQRTFSVDDEDVYSFLTNTVAEEIGCLFIFDSVKRSISVYDLKTVCLDCGHRGEFSDECPKCKSKNLKFFGKDTTIYIDTENLSSSITSSVDVDKVKNCFKLVAGDAAMTAAVKNCNPNGSSYIYYFSEDQKHEMPDKLVEKIESYDKLVESYAEPYQKVMKDMYEAIDKIIYYTSGMMPERKNDETDAKKEASKLTESAMSPLGLSKLNQYTSLATVNSAMKSYAKVFIKSGYFKAEPNESKFEYEGEDLEGVCYGYWYGNFKITNYSDEEDTAISPTVKIKVTDLYHTFLEQKIDKKLATTTDEEGSIYDVLKLKDLEKFKEALKLYCLNRLKSFYDAIQGAIDIMIEEDQANENADLYKELYVPYHDKLVACQDEMDKRNATIDEWEKTLDKTEAEQKRIQGILNFEKYLGEDMYKVFCTYKREDTYQNDNYISDGFENDEIFKRANEFIDAAKEELYKSGEHQRTVSGSLIDFMTMKEFAPLLDNFEIGNFIRIGTDEKIYRLRLVSYQISFDDMSNIDVEFSDVTKIKTGYSDLQSILDKTKSIASSYDAVAHQARSSKKQADVVKNWVQTGLDATLTKIVNNADNQNITMGDTGLLARRKDDFEDKYDDCQLKLLSTGLYVTDDSWRSVKTAIGKSYFTNPETGKQEMMYGVNAETLVGQMILGNQLGIYSSDGSSQMRFDNFGLVLNALDNGSGHYRRILDIQKDGVSQMYIDSDGNIVLATKQQIETTESIGRLNALYADIEKLYVSNATIEKLLAKYATIENLEAVKATIKDLDVGTLKADFAEIKKLIATDAEIGNLKADNVTIAGLLKANSAEIENLKSVKVSVGELEAYKITVNKLFSAYASIEYLESKYIDADTIKANYVKTAELDATVANINTLKANLAKVETLVAEKADIKDLNAVNANIDTINANLANINKLVAEKATIKDLTATNAKIDNLIANDIKAINATIDNIKANYVTTEILNAKVATINNLIAEKATIQDLNAAKADIGSLNAQVGNIGSILSGNIGTGTLQTIHLTAENLVVDEAVIKDLIASKIGVSDLKAGNISTDKFTIKSNDGGLQIVGSTQQFIDKNGNVRLQIGKDAKGNFSFIVVGEDGKTALYDQNGIKAEGIPDGLIVDKMVADNANIQASKVKYIDKDGNTTLQTVIDNQQGKINSLIKETTIDNGDGTTTSLKDSYNQTVQTVKGNTTTISDIKTSVNEVSGKVTKMDARVTKVEQTADGVKTTVTANKDKWDKASSDASSAVSVAGTANSNASNALNKANNLEQRANNGEFDGRGVKSTKVEYQASSSGTTTPSGTWSTIVPAVANGQYLWTRTTITYTSGEPTVGYSVARMGVNGAKGDDGKSPTVSVSKNGATTTITVVNTDGSKVTQTVNDGTNGTPGKDGATGKTSYFHVKYSNDGGKTFTANNGETVGDYLGTYTDFVETDSNSVSVYTWVKIKGNTGATGAKGETGSDGKGISSIVHHYLVTNVTTGVTSSTTGWEDTPQSVTSTNKYLWYYQTINYTTGSPTNTTPAIIGVYGDTGGKGATGKGITSVTPQYYLSNSNTTQTGGTWKTSQDTWSSGKYYWTRDSILWSDGTTTTTTPMLATALNNANSVANNAQTIANQTADKFTWIVKSGTNSTNFTLTDRTAQLVSDEINLKGLVKFSGLTSSTQKSLSEGKCLFPDLTFSIGTNNIEKYCNANTATYPNAVKVERIDRQSDTPTSSKHCMKVTLGTGSFTASCGFVQSVDSRANAVFVQRFIAKLPVGYEFVKAANLMGTGSNDEFISSTKGTGNYEEYVRVTKCGSKGTFNNGGYVYVRAINSSSATPTDNNPVVFYIASCTTYDITESSDYNAWGMDEIPDIDVTLINGGMIKTKSISTSQLNTHEILAQNGTFMNAINAQEINADRITSGKITSKRIDAYGLSILDKDRNIETFSIASDGQVTLRGSVESYDYISGKTGWSISYKGSAEFNDVTVRGSLITGDGGIASSGGLGVNLQKNTSFYNGLNDWTVSSSAWSVDKSVQYNGINSLKYSVSNLSVETISSCTTQAKSISAKSGDTFTAQAMFYTDNLSGITGTKPKFKIVFYNTAGTVLHEEAVTVSFVNKKWVLTKITATAPANTAYVGISFVGYLNGTFYISQPKIEKGNSATEWSLSPNDKDQVPRFWAGTTYENREYAPFIVYNDGSLKAAKGTFGGVFTGDIKIGNVSITDPNVSNGDDATITVINGNTGVKAVQLTDMSQSSFAQNISITDNFYNEQVRINQNGIVNALNQFVVGSIDGTGNERSILTKSYLQFKGGSIVSSDKRLTVERADNFDVGSVSNNTNLTVYGVGEFKKVLKITKELNFNDTVKCIVSDRGIDFNFYDNSQTRKKE